MVDQLSSAEGLTEFFDSLRSIIERTASVYHASDLVGLEICQRRLEAHTRVLVAISLSQNSTLGGLFEEFEDSLAVLLRKSSDILNASSFHQKEKTALAFSASTGGRTGYNITKEMIEQLLETGMNWRSPRSIVAASAPVAERSVKLKRLVTHRFHKAQVHCVNCYNDPVW